LSVASLDRLLELKTQTQFATQQTNA